MAVSRIIQYAAVCADYTLILSTKHPWAEYGNRRLKINDPPAADCAPRFLSIIQYYYYCNGSQVYRREFIWNQNLSITNVSKFSKSISSIINTPKRLRTWLFPGPRLAYNIIISIPVSVPDIPASSLLQISVTRAYEYITIL